MAPDARLDTIAALKSKIDSVLSGRLSPDQPFALLDFPDYSNIGDSAIFCGELAYFSSHGLRPAFVSSHQSHDWSEMDKVAPDGPILLRGGGNFGDVWPEFQRFREDVIARYPKRPIIQLPQTIKYDSAAEIERTARIIDKHGAITLLVRDQRSYDLASTHFNCEVQLCPDMAFYLGPLQRANPTVDLLLHLRTDHEASQAHDVSDLQNRTGTVIADWPLEYPGFRRRAQASALLSGLAVGEVKGAAVRERFFAHLGQQRLQRGLSLLGSARRVVTDRLHGHILCLLLGVPHCVLDNSYGKTSGFMAAWGTKVGHTWTASSLDEAVALLNAEGLVDS